LRIDQKSKNTPFLKEMIPRASEDETNFQLDRVSTNQPLLHFNTFLLHFFWFLRGHAPLKKVGPMCTWDVKEQPAYARRQETIYPRAYVTVSKTTRVHPQKGRKNKNARDKFLHEIVCNRMCVHWREREHEDIDILVNEDPVAMAALRQCGFWKFF
jgi:hypothetical protein